MWGRFAINKVEFKDLVAQRLGLFEELNKFWAHFFSIAQLVDSLTRTDTLKGKEKIGYDENIVYVVF